MWYLVIDNSVISCIFLAKYLRHVIEQKDVTARQPILKTNPIWVYFGVRWVGLALNNQARIQEGGTHKLRQTEPVRQCGEARDSVRASDWPQTLDGQSNKLSQVPRSGVFL